MTLSLEQQLELSRELARTVRSRLPLEAALTELSLEGRGSMRQAAELVGRRLAAGQSLSAALAAGCSRSTRMLAATIDIGQLTNRLDATLESWSTFHINVSRGRRRLLVAMLYPVLMILVACASLSYTTWQLVPHYDEAFTLLGNQAPGWFQLVLSAKQFIWLGNALVIMTVLMAAIWWWQRRSGFDAHGAPRDPSERSYLHAHTARLAAVAVGSGRPVGELRTTLLLASGGTDGHQPAVWNHAIVGRETAIALETLDLRAVSMEQCVQLLQSLANETERRADMQSERLARWLPMFISILVGMFVAAAYVGLIYLPWITLFEQLVRPMP